MKRTNGGLQMPDAIYASNMHQFTTIPNKMLRNPKISFKAKGLLATLLSNKSGWKSHRTALEKLTLDGETAISSGIQELEKAGYLLRIKYREKKTKTIKGSFWAYTHEPYQFDLKEHLQKLDHQGYEVFITKEYAEKVKISPQPGFLDEGFLDEGFLDEGNPDLKRSINKKINSKKKIKDIVPYKDIMNLYNEILGEDLPKARKLNSTRKTQIKGRWMEAEEHQNLDFWETYFDSVLDMPFLLGRNDRGWTADFEWLTKASNFLKVIEGKYIPRKKSNGVGTLNKSKVKKPQYSTGTEFELT